MRKKSKNNQRSKSDRNRPPAPADHDVLLTSPETAAILRVSTNRLEIWRVHGYGPQFVRVGRLVRYRRADIEAFIAASVRTSTSQIAVAAG